MVKTPSNQTETWLRRPSIWLTALLVVLLVGFGIWLLPKPNREITSLDGQHRWPAKRAPLQRTIVWQPASPVDPPGAEVGAGDSLIRPCLADDGNSLYFTLRRGDGGADIYYSRKSQGEWQAAEAVGVLNSPADDFGPVIRADGQELFFYSNREGGYGQFDLYVSLRTEDGWSAPRNLGPHVNSPADEYDPAITPDGSRLFFESNRSPRMQALVASGKLADGPDPWKGTLRVEKGLSKFDIYEARRADAAAAVEDTPGPRWTDVAALGGLNLPESNEGAPFVDANGLFLYFASDRPQRHGEDANYDIYRTRITESGVRLPENLGPGVNSAASEIEPALSASGFELFFSRSKLAEDESLTSAEQYALYRSDAIEIEQVTSWDDGNLQAFLLFLIDNWWWIILLLLLAAFLAALIAAVRNLSWRRVQVPTYLLIALLIHLFLAGGSFYVYFGDELIRRIKQQFQEEVVAELDPSQMHQSHKPGQQAYEKLADVDVETVKPSEIPRQDVQAPNVPVPSDTVIPRIPSKIQPDDIPKLTEALPAVEVRTAEPIELQRREELEPLEESEMVELETPEAPPVQETVQQTRPKVDVQIERTQDATDLSQQPPQLADLPPRTVSPPADVEPLEALPIQDAPTPTQQPRPTTELARADLPPLESPEQLQVPTDPLAAAPGAATAAPFQPTRAEVSIDRQDTSDAPSQLSAPVEFSVSAPRPQAEVSEGLKPGEEGLAETVPTSGMVPANIDRTDTARGAVDAFESEQVPTEAIASSAVPQSDQANPARVNVDVSKRSETAVTQAVFRPISQDGISARRNPTFTPTDTLADTRSAAVATPDSDEVPEQLARSETGAAPEDVEMAALDSTDGSQADSPAKSSRAPSKVTGIVVGLERATTELPTLPEASPDQVSGSHNPQRTDLQLAGLADRVVDAPLAFGRVKTKLDLPTATAPKTDFAFDAINLQTLLVRRQISPEEKGDLVKKYGGTEDALKAVRRGLSWMEMHQHEDGHWSLDKFQQCCRHADGKKCQGKGKASDTAATGFALLPFLGDGHTHRKGGHQAVVKKALDWLVRHQKPDGNLWTGGDANSQMYSHGIATIALCEAYGMSDDPKLREPAQRAINYIVNAQGSTGGWRYKPRDAGGDTSVLGWQVMALKSGQMADLYVPEQVLKRAEMWLDRVAGQGGNLGRFGYTARNDLKPAMTAEALLCLEYMGTRRDDPRLQRGAQHLLKHLPAKGKDNSYYWYYGTQVMYHLQGDYWPKWEKPMRETLLSTQHLEGNLTGTWDPKDQWENTGGRIFSTSLRVLMLEIYYRHLPLYQPLQ